MSDSKIVRQEEKDLGSNGKSATVVLDDGRIGRGHHDGIFHDGKPEVALSRAIADAHSKSVPNK